MAHEDPLENRSEYQPPTSPPKARVPSQRDYQSVKLDPTIDRRRARTQISNRSMRRASRSYTMTAFIAGALGALTASGVYLAMYDGDDPVAEPSAPVRVGVTGAGPSSALRVATVQGELATTSVTIESAIAPLAEPSPAVSLVGTAPHAGAPEQSTPEQRAPAQRTQPSHGKVPAALNPSAESPTVQARREASGPSAPGTAVPPEPSTEAPPPAPPPSSKAWVETPPRKVWVE